MILNEEFLDTLSSDDQTDVFNNEVTSDDYVEAGSFLFEFEVKVPNNKPDEYYIQNSKRFLRLMDRALSQTTAIKSHTYIPYVNFSRYHFPDDLEDVQKFDYYRYVQSDGIVLFWMNKWGKKAENIQDAAIKDSAHFLIASMICPKAQTMRQIKTMMLTLFKITVKIVTLVFGNSSRFVQFSATDNSVPPEDRRYVCLTSQSQSKWESYTDKDGQTRYIDAYRIFNGGYDKISRSDAMNIIKRERELEGEISDDKIFRNWLKKNQNIFYFGDTKGHFEIINNEAHITRTNPLYIYDFKYFFKQCDSSPFKIIYDSIPYLRVSFDQLYDISSNQFNNEQLTLMKKFFDEFVQGDNNLVIYMNSGPTRRSELEGKTIDLRNELFDGINVKFRMNETTLKRNMYDWTEAHRIERIEKGLKHGDTETVQWEFNIIMPDGKKKNFKLTIQTTYK